MSRLLIYCYAIQDSLTSCCFVMICVGPMIVIYTFNPSRIWAVNSVKQNSPTSPTSCSTKSTTKCSSPFYSQCCPMILLLKCYSLITNCLYTYYTTRCENLCFWLVYQYKVCIWLVYGYKVCLWLVYRYKD